MYVNYYFRNLASGYSIRIVFQCIVNQVGKYCFVHETFLPSCLANFQSIFQNGFFARRNQKKGEINHITGDVHYLLYFLSSKRTIVTVHDIMYYHYLKGIKRWMWKIIYIYPLKRAAIVTFISDFACQQVLEVIQLSKNRIVVIPDPINPKYEFVEKKFNNLCPIILHIGTLERKNLKRTILALQHISCHLRIVGRLNSEIVKLLNESHIRYSNIFDLSEEQIIAEYKRADIINFPSLFEGFGMPIIEGQATGRVVVTSNLSPMKEVAGEGAVLVDPYSVDDIRNAYHKIIQDASFREVLIKKGRENVSRFSVDIIAEQYMNIYKSMQQ